MLTLSTSAKWQKADISEPLAECLLMTQSGHCNLNSGSHQHLDNP